MKCWGFFLHMDIHLFQHHLLKRLSLLHWIAFAALLKISYPQLHGSTSRLSLLTDLVCQFLHQYHTLSIYSKSSNQVVLGLQFCSFSKLFWLFYVFCIIMNSRVSLSISTKKAFFDFDWDCIKSIDQFGKMDILTILSISTYMPGITLHLGLLWAIFIVFSEQVLDNCC